MLQRLEDREELVRGEIRDRLERQDVEDISAPKPFVECGLVAVPQDISEFLVARALFDGFEQVTFGAVISYRYVRRCSSVSSWPVGIAAPSRARRASNDRTRPVSLTGTTFSASPASYSMPESASANSKCRISFAESVPDSNRLVVSVAGYGFFLVHCDFARAGVVSGGDAATPSPLMPSTAATSGSVSAIQVAAMSSNSTSQSTLGTMRSAPSCSRRISISLPAWQNPS